MTTVTIWVPKSSLRNFVILSGYLERFNYFGDIYFYLKEHPVTLYTDKMHDDCLQINISLDLYFKITQNGN